MIDSPFGYLMSKISGTKTGERSEQFGLHSNEISVSQKSPSFSVKSMGLSCATHVARMKSKVIHMGFWGKTVHKLPHIANVFQTPSSTTIKKQQNRKQIIQKQCYFLFQN